MKGTCVYVYYKKIFIQTYGYKKVYKLLEKEKE